MRKFLFIILALAFLYSCEQSKKGAWTEADKTTAKQEMQKIDKDLSAWGDKKQAFIDCYLQKLEANYETFAKADADQKGCEKLAKECALSIMDTGSKKGAWSAEDKDAANKVMLEIDADLAVWGDKKQAFIDCYLQKLEANYESFGEANLDEKGCEKFATECAESLK